MNLGANIETIDEYGVYNFAACTQVNFNSKLRSIGEAGMGRMRKLKQITLPASLDSLGVTPFYQSSILTDIKVDAANPKFSAKDGSILSKDGAILYTIAPGITGESYTIPAGVKKISAMALTECEINNIVFPEGLEEIGDYALSYSTIQSLNLPASLKTIGDGIVSSCTGLQTITLAAGNAYFMLNDGFLLSKDGKICYLTAVRTGDCMIPQGVETVGARLCAGMNITSLTLPASVRTIDQSSFSACKKLTSINLNEGLDSIGRAAFAVAPITEITIPGTVTKMGEFAFNGCPSLKKAILKEGITYVAAYAFVNDAKLEEVQFPSTLKRIGATAFQGTGLLSLSLPENLEVIENNAFERSLVVGEIVFPEKVREIGQQAFNYMPNVTAFKTSKVEVLGKIAFGNCAQLKSVDLGTQLRVMGMGCVANSAMDSICIPATVDTIGENLFGGSSNSLAAINVLATNPPAVGGDFFAAAALGKYQTIRLYVPVNSVELYKNHPLWGKFTQIIGEANGVTEIESDDATVEYYDLNGHRIYTPDRGIYIVRRGKTVTKEVIR